ncbi:MAG: FecR family protein [Acidobacteria bacterium]|nr:FecR family protein [Acidobacteriota bacterium]
MRISKTLFTALAFTLTFANTTVWPAETQAGDGLDGYWKLDRIEAVVGPEKWTSAGDVTQVSIIDKGRFFYSWQQKELPGTTQIFRAIEFSGSWSSPPAVLVPGERLDIRLSVRLQKKVDRGGGTWLKVLFEPSDLFVDSKGREGDQGVYAYYSTDVNWHGPPEVLTDSGIFFRQVPGLGQRKELTLLVTASVPKSQGGGALGMRYIYRPLPGASPPSDRGTSEGMPVAGIPHQVPWPDEDALPEYSIFGGYPDEEPLATIYQIRINGKEITAEKKILYRGATITTGSGVEIVLQTPNGAIMTIRENTNFELKEPKVKQTGLRAFYGRLIKGAMDFYLPRGAAAQRKFEIETEMAITSIKGTDLTIQHSGNVTTIIVREGEVEVMDRSSGAVRTVHAGETAIFDGKPIVTPGREQSQWQVSTYPAGGNAGYWAFLPDGTMLGYTDLGNLKAQKPVWQGSYRSDAQGYLCRISINGTFYDFLVRMSQDQRSFEAFEKNSAGRFEQKYRTGKRLDGD